ncbi:MAG TPA: hypothetical protein VG892_00450, partial [Terriglobales bacterium]|nr:hypothetical protein [Terriglobales bacterium]
MYARVASLFLAISLLGVPALADSIVANGNFESGLTGWVKSGNTTYSNANCSGGAGTCFYEAGPVDSLGYLSQILSTTPGDIYTLSFKLWNGKTASGADENYFSVSWGGVEIPASVKDDVYALAWDTYTFAGLTASSINTTLKFAFQNDSDLWKLDAVSVTSSTSRPTSISEPS